MSDLSNMDRWIVVSLAKHFADVAKGQVNFMLEDQIRDTKDLVTWTELRVLGPEYHEWAKDEYTINVEVDLLINVRHDPSDIYNIHRLSGLFENECDNIPIYRYGNGSKDDDTLIFCLMLDPDMVSNIKKMYFGKVDDTNIKRVSIMAFYEVTTNL